MDSSKSTVSKGVLCYAINCFNYRGTCPPGVSFHKFPDKEKRPDLYDKWVHNCGRTSQPSHHARICSAHFEERCINRTLGRVEIRENAVPTIFSKFDENADRFAKSKESLGDDRKLFSAFQEPPPRRIIKSTNKSSTQTTPSKPAKPSGLTVFVPSCTTQSTTVTTRSAAKKARLSGVTVCVPNFHSYVADAPTLKTKVEQLGKDTASLRVKLSSARVRERKLRKKCILLEKLLNEKNNSVELLRDKILSYCEGCHWELFAQHDIGYTKDQREFALNLYLTSRKAYKYLRTKVSLPDQKIVRKWLSEGLLPPGVDAKLLSEWKEKKEAASKKEPIFDPVFHVVSTKTNGNNVEVQKVFRSLLAEQQSKNQNGMTRTENIQGTRRIFEEHTYSSQSSHAIVKNNNNNNKNADTIEVVDNGVQETDAESNSVVIPLDSSINSSSESSLLNAENDNKNDNNKNADTMEVVDSVQETDVESNSVVIPLDSSINSSSQSSLPDAENDNKNINKNADTMEVDSVQETDVEINSVETPLDSSVNSSDIYTYSTSHSVVENKNNNNIGADTMEIDGSGVQKTCSDGNSLIKSSDIHTCSSQSACPDAENSNNNNAGADVIEADGSGVQETGTKSNSVVICPVVKNNSKNMEEVSESSVQVTESNSVLRPSDSSIISTDIEETTESASDTIMEQYM